VEDSRLYVVGRMTSSSPAMFARRRRILAEARRLLAEGRADGFSVRELCDKAGVVPTTLYNAFGSKENVIALAISEYFEDFLTSVSFTASPDTIEGAMEREMTTTLRNLQIPQYVRAVAALYFSSSSELPLREVLIDIGGRPYIRWLQRLRVERQLERRVDLARVEINLAAAAYSHVQEWRAGLLDDDGFIVARFDSVLSYLSGITCGQARKDLRALFRDLHGPQAQLKAAREGSQAILDRTYGESGTE
jgi:AcrR family transcriptional regulator